jgi:putative peptidoglycan lipid II flippase
MSEPRSASTLARNATLVAVCTGLSRVLGFAREMASAALFGALPIADALTLAFNIPNFLRRLLGEGALTAAFLPMFSRAEHEGGDAAARRLVAVVGGAQLAVLCLLAVAGTSFCLLLPPSVLARFLESDAERAPLLLRYLTILFPYIVPICLYAFGMAILNARSRFFVPAFAPVLQNVVALAAYGAAWGVAGGFQDPRSLNDAELDLGARIVAGGLLAGGTVMFLVQLPSLRAERMLVRPRLEVSHPAFREFVRRVLPMVLSMGVVQLSVLFSSFIALAVVPQGGVVYLNRAARLFQLPQGMVGTAVATAAFPHLSRSWQERRFDVVRSELDRALGLATLLGVPAAMGLLALALPIVTVLFGLGQFTPEDCEKTAWVLVAFAPSIPFLTAVPLIVRIYYAAGDTRTPSALAASLVFLDLGLAYTLGRRFGAPGIASGTTAVSILNLLLLLRLARRFELPRSRVLAQRIGRILLVGAACGAAAAGTRALFEWSASGPPSGGRTLLILEVATSIGAGIAAFVGASRALKIPELDDLAALFRRRRLPSDRLPG